MKNYSSNRAQKGKTAYRTHSLYKANKSMAAANDRSRAGNQKVKFNAEKYFSQINSSAIS